MDRAARAELLEVSHDDAIARAHTFGDDHQIAVGRAERDIALIGLIVGCDDVDELSDLAGADRGLRDEQRVVQHADAQAHPDVLPRQQGAARIVDGDARRDGAGGAVDAVVEKRQLAAEMRALVVTEQDLDGQGAALCGRSDAAQVGVARIERDVDRIELD